MASHLRNEDVPDLELEVGAASVELRHMLTASSTFASLINEVAEEYAGTSNPIKWLVEVQPGCVRLSLRAEAAAAQMQPSAAHEIATVIADGLHQLEREAVRPAYFSDRALEHAKKLASMWRAEFPIAVRNGKGKVEIDKQLSVNAEKVLGVPRKSFGTVEGRLETLSIHGGNEFAIWRRDGTRVKCRFGKYITLDEVLPAVGKRVGARGRIKARPSGEILEVEVQFLRVLGTAPATADDVRGIFRGYETAEW